MLSSRGSQIIKAILIDPNIKSSELEAKLSLTRRQISYSVKTINTLLAELSLPPIERTHQGTFVIDSKTVKYLRSQVAVGQLKPTMVSNYAYRNEQQRIYTIVLFMLIMPDDVALVDLYDYLKISKTTTVSDLHKVKSLMGSYNLVLCYSRKNGYLIEGDEKEIRVLLNDVTEKMMTSAQGVVDIDDLSSVKIEPVIHFVHQIEVDLDVTYSDDAFQYITRVMQVTLARDIAHKNRQSRFFHNQVTAAEEYQLIKAALPEWWYTSQDATEWLTLIFMTGNTLHNSNETNDRELLSAVHQMVTKFEQKTLVFIQNRSDFERRLFLHLRPAYFRVKYGLPMKDVGIENVVNNDSSHRLLIKTIRQIISPIEKSAGRKFPNNEVELISFYFGAELQSGVKPIARKQRAAVVCSNGLIVAKIMYESLRQLFPEISFLSASSAREFQSYQQDYDLVFTTIPLSTDIKQFIVSPLMNQQERVQLRYRVLIEIGSIDASVGQILKIISANADIKNPDELQGDLRKYLLNQSTGYVDNEVATDTGLPSLSSYLSVSRIQIFQTVNDWKVAIEAAGQLLESDQKITDDYLTKIMQVTKSAKNYSFLGQHMAIPHASPEDGALADGFSLVVIKDGIDFPGDYQVKLVVMLAIKDTTKHLQAINQLNQLANDDQAFSQLLTLKTPVEVYEFLKQYE